MQVVAGPQAGEVYEYIGKTLTDGVPDIDDDADTTGNQLIDLSNQYYYDTSAWKLVSLKKGTAEVRARAVEATIHAAGVFTLDAVAEQTIDADVLAGAVGFAKGKGAYAGSGAGADSTNTIELLVRATIEGDGSGGITAGAVSLTAKDTSTITALTGAASVAGSWGDTTGISLTVGVGLAKNRISNDVGAFITDVDQGLQTTAGDIRVVAIEQAHIRSTAFAASLGAALGDLAVGISGAGADATNIVLTKANAGVDASKITSFRDVVLDATTKSEALFAITGVTAAGLDAKASDDPLSETDSLTTQLRAEFAAAGTALASGDLELSSLSTGRAWELTDSAKTKFILSLDAAGGIQVARPTIKATVISAAVGVGVDTSGNKAGVGASIGVALARNLIGWTLDDVASPTEVRATVSGSQIVATGTLKQNAVNGSLIDATVFAGSVAIGFSSKTSLSGAGAGAKTINRMSSLVEAVIDGRTAAGAANTAPAVAGINVAGISLNAADTSIISTSTFAASVAASLAGKLTASLSIAVGLAENAITNVVAAEIRNAPAVKAGAGGVSATASETSLIKAKSQAVSASLSVGEGFSAALSGGGADAYNMINNRIAAGVSDSTVTTSAGGDVVLTALDSSLIDARVFALSAAVSGGQNAVSFAIGASLSRNFVGYDRDGRPQTADVRAIVARSTLDVAGDLRQTATSSQAITTSIDAISAAVAVGANGGVAGAGAGTDAINTIAVGVDASIIASPNVAVADSIVLDASDTSTAKADGDAAAVAAAFGGKISVAIAVGVCLAENQIANTVRSGIVQSTVSAGTTLSITATESAETGSDANAAAVSLSAGVSLSGGGGRSRDRIAGSSTTEITNSSVTTGGALTVDARSTATAAAEIAAQTIAVGAIGIAVGVTEAMATVDPVVTSRMTKSQVTAGGDVVVTAIGGATATADANGVSASSGLAIAAAVPLAIVRPTLAATIEASSITTTGTLSLESLYNLDRQNAVIGQGATATAYAGSGGLAAGSGTDAETTASPVLRTVVDPLSTIAAGRDVILRAESASTQKAEATGASGGVVGVGASLSEATAAGWVTSQLDGWVTQATNVSIRAIGSDTATADSDSVAGGILGVDHNSATANVAPTVTAGIGNGAVVVVSGNLDVIAERLPRPTPAPPA